jgi:arylformamidase
MIHDISVRMTDQAPPYPGDPPFECRFVRTIAGGGGCNLSTLATSLHRGTHLDAPLHFVHGGKAMDAFPLSRFIVPAVVVDVPPAAAVQAEHLDGAALAPGDAVLLRTENSRRGWASAGVFREDYVAVSASAAKRLVELQASLVGIDYPTVERRGAVGHPAHTILLGAEIILLEGVNLAGVKPGRYTLHCPPLAMGPVEASPVRAVLIE